MEDSNIESEDLEKQNEPEDNQLSEAEKSIIDQAIPHIGFHEPYLAEISAMKAVALIGNKVLPYIKGKIGTYEFAMFVDLLAEQKDLDIVFESLEKSISNPDGSATVDFLNAINRIAFSIRCTNPSSLVLLEIFEKLKALSVLQFASKHAERETYKAISITGVQGAEEYISKAQEQLHLDGGSAKLFKEYCIELLSIPASSVQTGLINKQILDNPDIPKTDKNPEKIIKTKKILHEDELKTEPVTELEKQPERHILRVLENPQDEGDEPREAEFNGFLEAEQLPVFPAEYVNLFRELEELHEEYPDQEALIRAMEAKLGIENKTQRLLEAALLIDWKFFCVGIMADYSQVERMFGESQWMDWVTARLAARAYGDNPLTVDFISFLHRCLTKQSNLDIGGNIRYYSVRGADYLKPSDPIVYTREQAKAIADNPLLKFMQHGEDPDTGFIQYPDRGNQTIIDQLSQASRIYFEKQQNNRRLIEALLMDLCSWYNRERKKPHDPFELAAKLQRRFISIHSFLDVNGRVSRLLMDWSLENDNKKGAILFEPGEDILLPEKDWKTEVMMGSRLHFAFEKRRKKLEAIGYADPAEVFNLSTVKTFYGMIFKHIIEAPKPPEDDEIMDYKTYEDFIEKLQKEYTRFKAAFSATREVDARLSRFLYTQGDLIPQSFIRLTALKPKDMLCYQRYMEENFYSEIPVYRGGVCSVTIREADIVRMFESYIGAGTGYKALTESHTSPISASPVPGWSIARSLEFYNVLIASAYLKRNYPGKAVYDHPHSFSDVINVHVSNPDHEEGRKVFFQSPFASTSLYKSIAESWAKKTDIKGAKAGIMFSAVAPRYGGIFTFGKPDPLKMSGRYSDIPGLSLTAFTFPFEEELLVPGGISPVSIDSILIFEGNEKLFKAVKRITKDGIVLSITDYLKRLITRYKLNVKTGFYEKTANTPV